MDMPASGRRPKISATDAAFAGFGLVRRNPGPFVVWTVLTLVYGLAATGLQIWLAGPSLARMAALQSPGASPPSTEEAMQALASLGNLSVFYVAILIIALAYAGVMNAAIFRATLRPTERGLGYLRFGKDELRQVGVSFIVGLVIYGVYMAAIIVGIVLAVIAAIAVVAMAGGKEADVANNPGAIAVAVLAGVVVLVAIVAPLLIVAVRLSLAGPTTFMRGRVDAFGSWRLTKGRFWTLVGAYLLAAFVILVVSVLVMVLVAAVALVAGLGMDGVSHALMPDPKAPDSFASPLRLVFVVINAPLSALWIAVQSSIPATIYAQVTEGGDPQALDRSHAFGTAVAYPAPVPTAPTLTAPIAPTPPESPPPDTL